MTPAQARNYARLASWVRDHPDQHRELMRRRAFKRHHAKHIERGIRHPLCQFCQNPCAERLPYPGLSDRDFNSNAEQTPNTEEQ
jgi:hypothetical protein